MDLASIFSKFGNDPWANYMGVLTGGASFLNNVAAPIAQTVAPIAQAVNNYQGAREGAQTASTINTGVQQNLAQNNAATQAQIDSLNQQIAQNRQQAQDMYQRSLTDVTGQNQQLEGNIGTLTGSLNALSDPNSSYMQQARQAIERKDAAAGRRSQWGDREVQLAGTLADYVGKYSPGLQNSITGARDQISRNNQGLASLYATANGPADRNTLAQIAALQQQLKNTEAMNTTQREAANRATNTQTGATNSAIQGISQGIQGASNLLGGLKGLFGNSGTSSGIDSGGYGYTSSPWGMNGLGSGLGFTGNALDNDYLGLAGTGSLDQGMSNLTNPYGYTSMIGTGGGYEAPLDYNDPNSGLWD